MNSCRESLVPNWKDYFHPATTNERKKKCRKSTFYVNNLWRSLRQLKQTEYMKDYLPFPSSTRHLSQRPFPLCLCVEDNITIPKLINIFSYVFREISWKICRTSSLLSHATVSRLEDLPDDESFKHRQARSNQGSSLAFDQTRTTSWRYRRQAEVSIVLLYPMFRRSRSTPGTYWDICDNAVRERYMYLN